MRRRDLIALIGGSVAGWPSVLSAQPAERIRVVGALMGQGNASRSQALLSNCAMHQTSRFTNATQWHKTDF